MELKKVKVAQWGSKMILAFAIVVLIAVPVLLVMYAVDQTNRSEYWRDLYIETCIENQHCDVEEALLEAEDVAGPQGVQGLPGPEGPMGPMGPTGPTGPQGPRGSDGLDGSDGLNGSDGQNGSDGANGLNGTDGLNGSNGNDGTQGPMGPPGPQGPPGNDGLNGEDGEDGRGLQSLECSDAGILTAIYTDGTEQVIAACDPLEPIITE